MMGSDFRRRGALAMLAIPAATSLAATSLAALSPAQAAGAATPAISFETWLRVNTLVQTYADCIDRFDMEGLEKIFTPDAAYEYAIGQAAQGRKGIRDFLSPILDRYTGTLPFMSTPNISAGSAPGTYTAWTTFMADHNWKNGNHHSVYGRYVDEFQPDKESGALLIARRRVVAQLSENDPAQRFMLQRNG